MASKRIEYPGYRRLWGYAFDPSLSNNANTANFNNLIFKVRWDDYQSAGPVGEYLEVIDFDPASKCFYLPVDLNDINVVATDGLKPSESNPQFHQQMVYAVAMTTIQNFERALGRWILWSPRLIYNATGSVAHDEYVPRLRLYPHAIREANAFYNPNKKAILFGYFPAVSDNTGTQLPEGIVFTCLSHDIIAHEVSHAILDGINTKLIDHYNPDTLAFHEAFSDIIALFQHFTFREVIRNQIAKTRGDLKSQNLLGELAQQFGHAIGNYGSLRDAIGKINPETKKWEATIPDPNDYVRKTEPHERGSILVAAIFDAFVQIYKRRVADLFRLASNGTGILPVGELHPDLVNRLSEEASRSAQNVLNICIRALDYLPPVDMNFGDFLRALITADCDIVPDDDHNYRLIFIEAFRNRGIYPDGIKTLSVESLRWQKMDLQNEALINQFNYLQDYLKNFLRDKPNVFKNRNEYYKEHHDFKEYLHDKLYTKFENMAPFEEVTGLVFNDNDFAAYNIELSEKNNFPKFFVQSLAFNRRVDFNGKINNQAVISIIQKRKEKVVFDNGRTEDITFNGGVTLIFDLDSTSLIYAIKKDVRDNARLEKRKNYIRDKKTDIDDNPLRMSFDTDSFYGPFASLHNEKH
ncbi:MAG: hypothetical protein IPO92_09780 [Saprospiraceae bacterium]|nr:hypothetical protein [Saprospiraceae bacterium]